ncbi:MAG TPA: hypothetical protein PKN96_02570 [Flavobacterium sp.]|uniref:hypothetical protein n=1 Tax=Flavobacterium sp. TaxID=239 RepID=UPI002BCCD819|nr:hypothetical protein [Flavobacterium sp.]HNP32159.1 hypothetical protein [Flavobacterium sp.]
MIDFVKIKYQDKDKLKRYILEAKNFDIVSDIVDLNTGLLNDFPFTKLGVLDIKIFANSAYVQNSIHKMYNYLKTGNAHNYDDFSYSKLCETIDYLTNNLINLNETYITQFEFGLNLTIDKVPEHVVRRNVLFHNKLIASSNRFFGKGEYKQFPHTNFIIKVYDKGKQYQLKRNTLRLEVKLIRRIEFLKLGVSNIQDFKIEDVLRRCFKYFIMRFEQLIIIDDFDESMIADNEDYLKLNRYTNPLFWSEELKGKHPQKVARHRGDFEVLLKKYSLLQTKDYLRTKLIEKFNTLISE